MLRDYKNSIGIKRKIPNDHKLHKLFKKSIWIVPPSTLLAYKTLNDIHMKAIDQTIWVIDKYEKGYIFGTAYAIIDGELSSTTTLIGSITPLGDVLFAFYNDNTITSGQGKFIKIDGMWQFLMQMNTLNNISSNVVGLSHWSYMIKITDKCDAYHKLPGIGLSVPEMINKFNNTNQ